MIDKLFEQLDKQFTVKQLEAVLNLLKDDNTVPFIARYRKEMTGNLDEVQIRDIDESYKHMVAITNRQEEVTRLIDEQGKLTPELVEAISLATKLQQLDDIYRPYRPKRRTKATMAREKGLEGLALKIMDQVAVEASELAEGYVNDEVALEEALDGAHEIMAEIIGDEARYREWIRNHTRRFGNLISVVKDKDLDTRHVYENYYEFSQTLPKLASHQILALNRAEKEGVVRLALEVEDDKIMAYFNRYLVDQQKPSQLNGLIVTAYQDAYKRFIKPSIEREIRNELTEKADASAIDVFGDNLKNLLLQSPLKGKVVLGFDPAFRTGCKLAVVDATGKLLDVTVIYPHAPASAEKQARAASQMNALIKKYGVELIAIGNGTASRESEVFVANHKPDDVAFVIVNEAGASVYSASDQARKEFPDLQVEERSAISIARRLQDPLAELVKIEPKAVGVGQYQHDVSQTDLMVTLNNVVEDVVNHVGVDVNTASAKLLEYVSGVSGTVAQNIIDYREEHGAFVDRVAIKRVKRMGPKTFEQAVGFLRILQGKNILDATGIHPESYALTKKILKFAEIDLKDLGSDEATSKLKGLHAFELASELDAGEATVKDILLALIAPGRDVRESASGPLLRSDVLELKDLQKGMVLQGTVRNVVDFGAFVDIGVTEDGLVHISKMSTNFVRHPKEVVSVGDVVKVWIEDVDMKKRRIQLSMVESAA